MIKTQILCECVLFVRRYFKTLVAGFAEFLTSRRTHRVRKSRNAKRTRLLLLSVALSLSFSLPRVSNATDGKRKREREIFFNSRSRTQLRAANECEFYIVDPRARGGVYERINFIPLFPWDCMRKCQLYIATASLDIICDIGAFSRRDRIRVDRERGQSNDKSARMLARYRRCFYTGRIPYRGAIRIKICINRRCIPNSCRKHDI